jgi:hypothetical protein
MSVDGPRHFACAILTLSGDSGLWQVVRRPDLWIHGLVSVVSFLALSHQSTSLARSIAGDFGFHFDPVIAGASLITALPADVAGLVLVQDYAITGALQQLAEP